MKKNIVSQLLILFSFFSISNAIYGQNTEVLPDRVSFPKHTSAEIENLTNVAEGQMVFDTDLKSMVYFNGIDWNPIVTKASTKSKISKVGDPKFNWDSWLFDRDSQNNIIICGYFNDSVTVADSLLTNFSNQVFLAKLNENGDRLWLKTFGGTGDTKTLDMAIDQSNNIYITGSFQNNLSGSCFSFSTSGGFDSDSYLIKYDSNGICQWARKDNNPTISTSTHLILDNAGNPIIVGTYQGTSTFSGLSLPNSPGVNVFLVKYNTTGTVQILRSISGTGSGCNSISINNSNEIFMTGYFYGNINVGGISLSANPSEVDLFITKLDPNLNTLWAQEIDKTTGAKSSGTFDSSGNIYLTSIFDGPFNFQGETFDFGFSNLRKVFLIKMSPSGGLLWKKVDAATEGGISIAGLININDKLHIGVNTSKSILINGEMINTILEKPIILSYSTADGSLDEYLDELSPESTFTGMSLGINGKVFGYGRFSNTLILKNQTAISTGPLGFFNLFLYEPDL